MNSFIPDDLPGQTLKVPAGRFQGKTMIKAPFSWVTDCFMTDNRGFSNDVQASARTHSELRIDLSAWPRYRYHSMNVTGKTYEVDCEDGAVECEAQAPAYRLHILPPVASESSIFFPIMGAASDPCFTGAPDVDYEGVIKIDVLSGEAAFEGKLDTFPNFEMYAMQDEGKVRTVFQLSPEPGTSPLSLYGSANRIISSSVKI
jgi:hypothetical protein